MIREKRREKRREEETERTYMSIQAINITLQALEMDDPQNEAIVQKMVNMMLPGSTDLERNTVTRRESAGSVVYQNRSELCNGKSQKDVDYRKR